MADLQSNEASIGKPLLSRMRPALLIIGVGLLLGGIGYGGYRLYREKGLGDTDRTTIIDGTEYQVEDLSGRGETTLTLEEQNETNAKKKQELEQKATGSGEISYEQAIALAQQYIWEGDAENALKYYELAKEVVPQTLPDRSVIIEDLQETIDSLREELQQ